MVVAAVKMALRTRNTVAVLGWRLYYMQVAKQLRLNLNSLDTAASFVVTRVVVQ